MPGKSSSRIRSEVRTNDLFVLSPFRPLILTPSASSKAVCYIVLLPMGSAVHLPSELGLSGQYLSGSLGVPGVSLFLSISDANTIHFPLGFPN